MTKKITKENVSEELLKSIKKATIHTKKKKEKKEKKTNYNLSLDRIGVSIQNLEDAVISIKHNEEIIKM